MVNSERKGSELGVVTYKIAPEAWNLVTMSQMLTVGGLQDAYPWTVFLLPNPWGWSRLKKLQCCGQRPWPEEGYVEVFLLESPQSISQKLLLTVS